MAQTGYTPIQLYRTTTASAAPTAGNLADGELAINTTDEKLYFKNAGGTVKLLAANVTPADNGGTGQSSYTIGDLLYASGSTTLSKLADVATGNALISGGVGAAPSYGKIGLTTHISGTLPVGNGGTGTATTFTAGSVVFAGASGVYSQSNTQLFWDGTNNYLGLGTATPSAKLDIASGNLAFSGSAQRITGDFSNATIANRVMIQTSTVNGSTGVVALPNGTGTSSTFIVTSGSDVANTSFGQIAISSSLGFQLQSSVTGTGTNLPMTFYTAGSERARIDTSGNMGIGTASPASKLDVNGAIRDSKGDVRTIVQNAQTAAYVLVAADAGKHISITTGGVTVNTSIFSAGDAISIYNNSAASQTITQGTSVTMYLGGTATTGNRTLAQRGICTILCVASNTFVISGAGLT